VERCRKRLQIHQTSQVIILVFPFEPEVPDSDPDPTVVELAVHAWDSPEGNKGNFIFSPTPTKLGLQRVDLYFGRTRL